jgi:hypothetical protein
MTRPGKPSQNVLEISGGKLEMETEDILAATVEEIAKLQKARVLLTESAAYCHRLRLVSDHRAERPIIFKSDLGDSLSPHIAT